MRAVHVLGPDVCDNPNRGTTLSGERPVAPIERQPGTSAAAPRLADVRVTRSDSSAGWRGGLRVGIGLAVGAFALAVSFGAFAVTNGWPAWLAIVMSAVTFSGSAQFALVTAASGGSIAGGRRCCCPHRRPVHPDGRASARSLHGGPVQRALEGQAVVDGSWVAAQNGDGTLDRGTLFGATLVQWPACGSPAPRSVPSSHLRPTSCVSSGSTSSSRPSSSCSCSMPCASGHGSCPSRSSPA